MPKNGRKPEFFTGIFYLQFTHTVPQATQRTSAHIEKHQRFRYFPGNARPSAFTQLAGNASNNRKAK